MKRIGTFLLVVLLFFSCDSESNDDVIQIMEYNDSSEYIAVFGDIQYYTINGNNISLYQHSCNWILTQKHVGMNINSVLLVGDVTHHNLEAEWNHFKNATQDLAQEIPYISAIGDHDYTWSDEDGHTITDRNDTEFSKYLSFPLTKQKVVSWFEKGHMENIVVENYIHGLPIYLLVLEFGPRREVVEWANKYVKSHTDVHFILITHEYLKKGGERINKEGKCDMRFRSNTSTTYMRPEELWNKLIKCNDNILCVLCGHCIGLYYNTLEKNNFGREVPQIQHNIQGPDYRYDNWLMLWEFPKGSDTANVSIINTKSMKYFNDKPVLFKFKYKTNSNN